MLQVIRPRTPRARVSLLTVTQSNIRIDDTDNTRIKSSAVAEMGDCGHNRHGPNGGGAAVPLSRGGS